MQQNRGQSHGWHARGSVDAVDRDHQPCPLGCMLCCTGSPAPLGEAVGPGFCVGHCDLLLAETWAFGQVTDVDQSY